MVSANRDTEGLMEGHVGGTWEGGRGARGANHPGGQQEEDLCPVGLQDSGVKPTERLKMREE